MPPGAIERQAPSPHGECWGVFGPVVDRGWGARKAEAPAHGRGFRDNS